MKRPGKVTGIAAAGIVALGAGIGVTTYSLTPHSPAEHVPSTAFGSAPGVNGEPPSGVIPQVKHQPWCDITMVPGGEKTRTAIEGAGNALAQIVLVYDHAVREPLPPGWTPERLTEGAKKEIAETRASLDKLLDYALDGIASGGIPDWHPPEGRGAVGPCPDEGK